MERGTRSKEKQEGRNKADTDEGSSRARFPFLTAVFIVLDDDDDQEAIMF